MDGCMSLTIESAIEAMLDSTTAVQSAVNTKDGGSSPSLAAKEENWNEEEGILSLQEFRPQVPVEVSLGIKASRDPDTRRELKKVFLDVLRSTGSILEASRICKIPKSLAFAWRHQDPEFAYRWDQISKTELLPHLEAEAIRRALNGSDLLLMFMMKALDREKYDDKAAEKHVNRPQIMIQIRDVDKSLVAIAGSSAVPGIEYETGKLLDGKKNEPAPIEAEFDGPVPSNGPITGSEGAS